MFTTYSASAGSGKTTNLVADYLALCFRFDSRNIGNEFKDYQLDLYQKILAITFTNNASGEMKSRIVHILYSFSFKEMEEYDGSERAICQMVVKKLFGENHALEDNIIRQFIRTESKELLRRIIFDYARFTISTIDSFFQRVIRSSALSLDLNLNYTVQIDMDEFYLQAIDQLLNELSANTELARRIVFLLDNSMEDTGKMDVDKELKTALKILYDNAEKNFEYLQILDKSEYVDMMEYIRRLRVSLKDLPTALKERLKPITQEGDMWVKKLDLKFKRPTFGKWFSTVQEDPISNYVETMEEFYGSNGQLLSASKFTKEEQDRIEECMPHIEDCFRRMVEQQNVWRRYYLDGAIRNKNADKILILRDLKLKMEEIKIQNNFFILSETNTLIYKTIRDRGFETLFDRVKFDNFYIDEFQDTSKMQWEDLKPIIINNALSQHERQVSLFGDVKQAIYRFRNGDADLFYKLLDYNRFKEDPDLVMVDEANYRKEPLDTNYRSKRCVVEFNNEFFKYYSSKLSLDKYYAEGLEQKVHHQEPGQVQICLFTNKDSKQYLRTSQPIDKSFLDGLQKDNAVSVQDMEVLCAVMDARARGYKDGDIAVLCRNNRNCAHLSDIMLRLGWNVVTEKSLNLGTSAEVNLIIYTLQYLLHPDDAVAQSTILYYMARLQDKKDVLSNYMPRMKESGFFESLMERELGKPIPRNRWLSEPLFLLVKDIIVYYGMQSLQSPFLVDFENLVWNYLQDHNGEPSKFLMWWQQQVSLDKLPSLSLPSGQDAVRLSSIHKSKGLQYPVVIMPYTAPKKTLAPIWDKVDDKTVAYVELTSKNSKGSSYQKMFEEETLNAAMDDLNVLYVAHTRACDMLYIIAKKSQKGGGAFGDCLHNFVMKNDNQDFGFVLDFENDIEDARYFYLGDRQWRKQEKKEERGHPSVVNPAMVASDFELEKVRMEYSPEISEDDPRAEGTFVHDFLAKLADFPQTEEAFEQCMADVSEAKKTRLREAFAHILSDDDLRPCFAEGVRVLNEVTILGTDGKEHRPDRVVFLNDKVIVIDYKTGAPHESYQQQIDGYCALLRNMGYENVEGRLLYV